jgi:hypothetical protein
MKEFDEKLNLPPFHPEVTARVIEFIRSMTPEEAKAFLEYRKPGIPEYWLGDPIYPNGRRKPRKKKTLTDTK